MAVWYTSNDVCLARSGENSYISEWTSVILRKYLQIVHSRAHGKVDALHWLLGSSNDGYAMMCSSELKCMQQFSLFVGMEYYRQTVNKWSTDTIIVTTSLVHELSTCMLSNCEFVKCTHIIMIKPNRLCVWSINLHTAVQFICVRAPMTNQPNFKDYVLCSSLNMFIINRSRHTLQ